MARFELIPGQFDRVRFYLNEGWSIYVATKKAGIVAKQYQYLMATNKEFSDMVRKYVKYTPRSKELPVVHASKFIGEMTTLLPRGK